MTGIVVMTILTWQLVDDIIAGNRCRQPYKRKQMSHCGSSWFVLDFPTLSTRPLLTDLKSGYVNDVSGILREYFHVIIDCYKQMVILICAFTRTNQTSL